MVVINRGTQYTILESRIDLEIAINLATKLLVRDDLKIVLITKMPSRMDDNTKLEVKPIVSPTVPVPIKRRTDARMSFTIEDEIIMIGNDFVFNDAITTERNNIVRTEEPMNNIAISISSRSKSKISFIQF